MPIVMYRHELAFKQMAENIGYLASSSNKEAKFVYAKRARRRADKLRMKRRAWFVAKVGWGYHDESRRQKVERIADHIKVCSCWMCGNQRRWHGKTFQEIKYAIGERAAAESDGRGTGR